MKKIFLFVAILFSIAVNAQVTKVKLQASGLTCSMCSNAINKALKTLDFVEAVKADIKNYTFDISIKTNSKVDFDRIRKKVEGAGFFVVGFTALINFDSAALQQGDKARVDDMTFLIQNWKGQILQGLKEVKILNKGFVSPKEVRRYKQALLSPGDYYVAI